MANEEHVALLKQGVGAWNEWRRENPGIKPDLSCADLYGLDLSGANLTGANLSKSYISGLNLASPDRPGVNFSKANLAGANFSNADLSGVKPLGGNLLKANLSGGGTLSWADFSEANLSAANLSGANLSGVRLAGANLSRAHFSKTDLTRAVLTGANFFGGTIPDTIVGVNLSGTEITKDRLSRIDLTEADRFGADLTDTTLSRTIFARAILFGANLSGVDLIGTDFSEAHLERANLQGATLQGARLTGAKLWRTVLRGANLQDAAFTETTGLLAGQLAGANVCGTQLPEDISRFEGLANVKEISESAQKVFLSMLLACVYSWLTIATTTDVRLLTNSISSPLPIIGTAIPIVGFYIAAPLLLLGLYVYLHLYLQRLWEGLADLPAVFPDGMPLDKKASAWLLNGLVRSHCVLLKTNRPPLSSLQMLIVVLFAWCVVPLTLFSFWLRYLYRHVAAGTALHIILVATCVGFGVLSYLLTRATLRGKTEGRYRYGAVAFTVAAGVGFVLFYISLGSVEREHLLPSVSSLSFESLNKSVRRILAFPNSPFSVNLRGEDISVKPPDWTGSEEELPFVKGAFLKHKDLRDARAGRVFLVNADLRRCRLQGAYLFEADLRRAVLHKANLQKAMLEGAKLQQADLSRADLQGADLDGTNLQGSILFRTNLQRADLKGANLQNAFLQEADLQEVLGLTTSQVKAALNWKLALYGGDFLKKLGLPSDHNDRVRQKNLSGYDLQDASLDRYNFCEENRAILSGTNLSRAKLRGASLPAATLQGVNLTGAQLQGANLIFADLRRGVLLMASLQGADLRGVKLQGANLTQTDFQGANLIDTDLQGANLFGTNLKEVEDLTPVQIKTTLNWEWAFYSTDFLKELGLPPDHNEKLPSRLAGREKASAARERKSEGAK